MTTAVSHAGRMIPTVLAGVMSAGDTVHYRSPGSKAALCGAYPTEVGAGYPVRWWRVLSKNTHREEVCSECHWLACKSWARIDDTIACRTIKPRRKRATKNDNAKKSKRGRA